MTWLRARPNLRSDWAYFAGICLFAVLLRLPIAAIPLGRNEAGYAYIAQRWIQGDIPYHGSLENKPPGVYLVYALLERIIGTSPSAIHWGMQLYTLGTLALIFVLGRRLSGSAGGLAAAAFAAFMTTDPSVLGNAATPEVFMILPLTAAMLASCCAVERESLGWAFLTGVLAGLALIFQQVALGNVVFYALFVIWMLRRRLLAAPTLLLGLLTVPALAGVYFAQHGVWEAFSKATVGPSLAYASEIPVVPPESVWMTLSDVLRSFWPLVLLAAVQMVGGLFGASFSPGAPPPTRIRRNTWLVLIWLGASCVGTVGGGSFRPYDYVQLIPPLAVLAGMAVRLLTQQSRNSFISAFHIALGLVIVPIAIGVLSSIWYYAPGDVDAKSVRISGGPLLAESLAVGSFIANHSTAQDSVFVLGSQPQILFYTARRSATRYISVYPLTGPFPDARQRQVETLSEVRRNNPRFIVTVFLPSSFAGGPETPSDIFDGTREILSHSYRIAAVLAGAESVAPLVSGQKAEEAWLISPVWYGTPSWCALAVWERVQPTPGADRAAADAENALGVGLAAQGDNDAAVAHYREAIRLDPDFAAPHNNLAAALANKGQTNDAIEQYVEAVRLSPLNPQPHWNLAVLLQEGDRLGEALEQFRAAVQLNPLMAEMRYRLATTYAKAGQVREAEVELGEVLRERPEWSAAEATLAWLLATADDAQLRNGARAVQLAEDAAQRTRRRDANVLNSLAAAYAEVGRYTDAAAIAAQAMEIAPSSGQAALHDALAARLAQYRAGHPVREHPGAPQP